MTKSLEAFNTATLSTSKSMRPLITQQAKLATSGAGLSATTEHQNQITGKYIKNTQLQGQAMSNLLPHGFKVQTMYKTMADGSVAASHKMVDASKYTLSGMLSFKSMIGKMMHYITFSIGVQMVMKLREGLTTIITSFRDFERSIVDAAAVAGNLGGAFDRVTKHLSQMSLVLGSETIFSAQEVAEALYDLASAGYDVANMSKSDLTPILNYAAATQSDLKDATYAVTSAMKAFGMGIEETERIVDTFTATITNSFMTFEKMQGAMRHVGPIAGALGMDLEEVAAALAVLTDTGLTGEQAGQRLNMIFTKLLKPTDEAEENLRMMGLTVQDLNPEIYSLTEILLKLRAANFSAAVAAGMFRARTASAAAVLVEAADSVGTYTSMLKGSAGITERVAGVQINTLYGSLKLLQDAFQETAISMGQKLAPTIKSVADFMRDTILPALTALAGFLQKNWGWISKLITVWIMWKAAILATRAALGIFLIFQKIHLFLLGKESLAESILSVFIGKKNAALWMSVKATAANIGMMQAAAKTDVVKIASVSLLTERLGYQAGILLVNNIALQKDAVAKLAATGATLTLDAATKKLTLSMLALKIAVPVILVLAAALAGLWLISQLSVKDYGNLNEVLKESSMNMEYMATQVSLLDMAAWTAMNTNQSFTKSLDGLVEKYDVWKDKYEELKPLIDATSSSLNNMGMAGVTSLEDIAILYYSLSGAGVLGVLFNQEGLYGYGVALGMMADETDGLLGTLYGAGSAITKFFSFMVSDSKKAEIEGKASFSSIVEGLNEFSKEAIYAAIYSVDLARMTYLLVTSQSSLQTSLKKLNIAKAEYSESLSKVEKLQKDGIGNTLEYAEANRQLVEAKRNLENANQVVINSLGGLLQRTRSYSETLDDAVGHLEDYYSAQRRIRDLSSDVDSLTIRQTDAVAAYSEALAKNGINSKEVHEAGVELDNIAIDLTDRMIELQEAEESSTSSLNMYKKMMSDTGYVTEKTYNQLIDMGWAYQRIEQATDKTTAAEMAKEDNRDKAYKNTYSLE